MWQSEWVCGCDEAGRGPLAGPVTAAAVILAPTHGIDGLADSKKLSAKRREALVVEIETKAISWAVAHASVAEIDEINILQASLLAMKRAIEALSIQPNKVLVDGNQIPKVKMDAEAIVKGDSKVAAISAASILAKVARDNIMLQHHEQWPHFNFKSHKGYPTKAHLEALQTYGILPIHRMSFAPVRKLR